MTSGAPARPPLIGRGGSGGGAAPRGRRPPRPAPPRAPQPRRGAAAQARPPRAARRGLAARSVPPPRAAGAGFVARPAPLRPRPCPEAAPSVRAMAALGIAALRRGGGAAPRLLAVAVSCHGCRARSGSGPADGGHGQPREPLPGGRARRGAEPGPVAGGQPAPSEGADTRSYLWARYHEMKKLVYGKGRAPPCRSSPPLSAPCPAGAWLRGGGNVAVRSVRPLPPWGPSAAPGREETHPCRLMCPCARRGCGLRGCGGWDLSRVKPRKGVEQWLAWHKGCELFSCRFLDSWNSERKQRGELGSVALPLNSSLFAFPLQPLDKQKQPRGLEEPSCSSEIGSFCHCCLPQRSARDLA